MRRPSVDESARNRRAVVAGLATGGFLTWNVSNVGAAADPLAGAYGTSLAVIGLLTTGLPFAVIFEAAQRLRADAPAAAVALVNGCAVLAILVGTPLAGLAFDLPGEGAIAFAAIALLAAAALPLLRRFPG